MINVNACLKLFHAFECLYNVYLLNWIGSCLSCFSILASPENRITNYDASGTHERTYERMHNLVTNGRNHKKLTEGLSHVENHVEKPLR